ncbi:MAG: hypothetical protein RMJ97_02460 [Raineya sp.]|nr:hypothetical protein [Raineya sp.]
MKKFLAFKIAVFVLFSGLVSFVLLKEWLFFLQNDYQAVLGNYLQKHPNIYRHQFFGQEYFTPQNYENAKIYLGVAVFVIIGSQIVFWVNFKTIKKVFYECINEIKRIFLLFKQDFSALKKSQKILLGVACLMIVIHQIYMYFSMPGGVDESYSSLFFSSQGLGVTLTHYPAPNNHIFYNLTSIFWKLFVKDTILAVRLTPLLTFWLTELILFVFLLRKNNFQVAFLTILLVGLGFSQSFFSVHGRGYMTYGFFSVLAFLTFIMYLQNKHALYLWIFGIACVLGFWTMPIFLYIMATFYVFLLWELVRKKITWKIFNNFILAGLLISACIYLGYVGILTYGGTKVLIGNSDINRNYELQWFFTYYLPIVLRESVWYVVGLPKYVSFVVFVIVVSVATWIVWYKHPSVLYQRIWQLLITFIVVTVGIIIVMRVSPFYRAWTNFAIFFAWAGGFVLGQLWHKISLGTNISLISAIFVGSFFQFAEQIENAYEPHSHTLYTAVIQEARWLVENSSSLYVSEEAFFVRFWVEYWNKESLLRNNPCRADRAVTVESETLPSCQEPQKVVWFFRVYEFAETSK